MDLASVWRFLADAWTPSVTISTCALLFTVATFWWLNVRQGRLRSFPPRTFAAIVAGCVRIRLPLVFHATGAKPIVVQDLRLRLIAAAGSSDVVLEWISVRNQLKPTSSDEHQYAAVFAVPGRGATQVFADFGVEDDMRDLAKVPVSGCVLEAMLGHRRGWRQVLKFELHTGRIEHLGNWITYRNAAE